MALPADEDYRGAHQPLADMLMIASGKRGKTLTGPDGTEHPIQATVTVFARGTANFDIRICIEYRFSGDVVGFPGRFDPTPVTKLRWYTAADYALIAEGVWAANGLQGNADYDRGAINLLISPAGVVDKAAVVEAYEVEIGFGAN